MEKKGRGGKTVTVVYGLPRNVAFLKELTRGAEIRCAAPAAPPAEDSVELQGDLRDRVRDLSAEERLYGQRLTTPIR